MRVSHSCFMMFAMVAYLAHMPVQAESQLTDQMITDHVEDELLFDQAVMSVNIDVETDDGVVSLTGKVNNILAQERATKIVQLVKGVRSIINRVKVIPNTERTDQQIQKDVKAALLADPATESYDLNVSVSDGVVTLKGETDSWQEKELAATVAKGVRGVTGFNNRMSVNVDIDRPDYEIQQEISKALEWSVHVNYPSPITVQVNDGVVTLTGTVGSAAEQSHAIKLAWVSGVNKVDSSGLEVGEWTLDPGERKTAYPSRSDQEIETAIVDALLYDPRVTSFNVDVESEYGRVTLRGEVDNLKAKRAAADTARNTVGVNSVKNRIKVRLTDTPEDGWITDHIRDALFRSPYTESYEISVSVENGIVSLDGDVDTYFEKSQAEDIASRVQGVIWVDNNLRVSSDNPYVYDPYVDDFYSFENDHDISTEPLTTYAIDSDLEEDIESQMWWSPFVDSNEVNVTVNDGTTTLTGTVDTLYEKLSATENAVEGGASSVINQLSIN